jgi:tetratricopeptide (TPR) repeat protein
MNPRSITAVALLSTLSASGILAQTPTKAQDSAAPSQDRQNSASLAPTSPSPRANAYFDFTMGHIYEEQYENTSKAEYATQAIEFYKKAYAADPKSPVIGERLAEMYWKAQRIREATNEAQEVLKRDPNDVPTRRLLARIYLRSLGDLSAGSGQSEMAGKAIEQYQEIRRLDPSDTESALWLARLYRLRNEHDKAEEVLRGILKDDPENEAAGRRQIR